MSDETDEARRKRFHAIGRAAGRAFRKGSPGREVAKRTAGTVARRGLMRLLRRF
jgi:hypothetical protein